MNLISNHNRGFFSCCSLRLDVLINFFNNYKSLPLIYTTVRYYELYKNNPNEDITFYYFKHYHGISDNIIYSQDINYKEYYQVKNYKTLDFEGITPFIKKYFTPTDNILNIIKTIENKYNLDYDNICVLFFKGKKKYDNVELPSYDVYIEYAKYVLNIKPDIKFLIQSNETNFILEMTKEFPNSIIFYDEIRHVKDNTTSVDIVFKEMNFEYSLKYLAITIIMSKCKYIICNSGNCSIWIIFYRGNMENVIQLGINTSI